jgi:DNA repair Crb2-like protein
MNRLRFSIGSFLAVITLVALGLGAIASQSIVAASLAYTVFISLVCLAAAVAIAPHSPRRAFCAGFAVFGLAYWLVEFQIPDSSTGRLPVATGWAVGPQNRVEQAQLMLITREILYLVERNLTPRREVGTPVMAVWANNGRYYPATIVQQGEGQYQIQWVDGGTLQWTPSRQITANSPLPLVAGHALMGGLFALLGGALTLLLASERPDVGSAKPSAAT